MKNYENSICWKVDQSILAIEQGIKNNSVNVSFVSRQLHAIREDAQKMEEGLRRRKEIMEASKLEEGYQKEKGNMRHATRDKLIVDEIRENEKMDFEITIKDKGKVIYHENVSAGIVCSVEKVTDIEEDATISGVCQKLYFGHDLSIFFAFDQMRIGFEDRLMRIASALHTMRERGDLKHPVFKKKVLSLMNNIIPV